MSIEDIMLIYKLDAVSCFSKHLSGRWRRSDNDDIEHVYSERDSCQQYGRIIDRYYSAVLVQLQFDQLFIGI